MPLKPAACLLDKTTHGGVITTPVSPRKVFVGIQPIACVGDVQVCPMVDVLKPHVGGPIISGSTSVFVNGFPVARGGDTVQCVGPPGQIVAVRKVLVG
jgi:uncharacterized Zn-binding protein involved in type VI secretion